MTITLNDYESGATQSRAAASLSHRIANLTQDQLRLLLERLAAENEAFALRIDCLTRPTSAVQDIARRITAIRRDPRSLDWNSSGDMANRLEGIASDITRDILPHEPVRALALLEALIALDEPLLERTHDDSGLFSTLEDIAAQWPAMARAVRASGGFPLMDWKERLREVMRPDECGIRAGIFENAHLLLSESEQQRLREALDHDAAQRTRDRDEADTRWASVPFRDVCLDLHGPDPYARLIRPRLGSEAEPEAEEVIRFMLDCGDFAEALSLLGADRGFCSDLPQDETQDPDTRRLVSVRLDLLDRAYGQLGDTARRIEVRRERFRLFPALSTYRRLAELLDDSAAERLRAQVRDEVRAMSDRITAAQLLFEVGCGALAQILLLTFAKVLAGDTAQMVALAEQGEQEGYPLSAAIVWRALLNPILERGLSKSYRYGALYLCQLQRLADIIDDYKGLPTHEEYEETLRRRHRLKSMFWRQPEIR